MSKILKQNNVAVPKDPWGMTCILMEEMQYSFNLDGDVYCRLDKLDQIKDGWGVEGQLEIWNKVTRAGNALELAFDQVYQEREVQEWYSMGTIIYDFQGWLKVPKFEAVDENDPDQCSSFFDTWYQFLDELIDTPITTVLDFFDHAKEQQDKQDMVQTLTSDDLVPVIPDPNIPPIGTLILVKDHSYGVEGNSINGNQSICVSEGILEDGDLVVRCFYPLTEDEDSYLDCTNSYDLCTSDWEVIWTDPAPVEAPFEPFMIELNELPNGHKIQWDGAEYITKAIWRGPYRQIQGRVLLTMVPVHKQVLSLEPIPDGYDALTADDVAPEPFRVPTIIDLMEEITKLNNRLKVIEHGVLK